MEVLTILFFLIPPAAIITLAMCLFIVRRGKKNANDYYSPHKQWKIYRNKLTLVFSMRQAQKQYFATRAKGALIRSKELEKKV